MNQLFSRLACALGAATLFSASIAQAADFSIGFSADITAFDPHYHNVTPNIVATNHVFESLTAKDVNMRAIPALATSWKVIDPTTWEFSLRKGVKFHDGSDFTAEDVIFSFDRVSKVPNSPSPFTAFVKGIKSSQIVDPHTIRFSTGSPYPLLALDLGAVMIVSKKAAMTATTDDFNSGKAAMGTGPYKLAKYSKGDRVELLPNSAWWGGKTPWDKLTMRIIPSDPARVAALLSGDVQLIENVPTADVPKLKTNANLTLERITGNRLIYLHLDSNRDTTPFAFDKQGKPLAKNPLKDPRVRLAISKAINREAIVSRIMDGEAEASGQLVPKGAFGYTATLPVEKLDVDGAKKLLAEAGYPEGFALTIHGPNNRYVNDDQILQAVAQMLSRVGIAMKVEAMPSAVFFTRASKQEFSLFLVGWSPDTGEISGVLRPLLATFDNAKGWGTANRGRYSNPKADALMEEGLREVNDAKREALLIQSMELSIKDTGIIPLHFQTNVWGMKKGFGYTPRVDERTFAHQVMMK